MGAASEGFKAGKNAGQRQGRRAGANSDPEENIVKEGAKSATKGAVNGMADGAASGAVRGGISGVKDGVQTGAKIGGAIPYVGAVTGPLGGVIGGAIGGVSGTVVGGTTGAVSGATSGMTEGATEAVRNKERNSPRKAIGSLWDNIKGAYNGNKKDIFLLKAKAIIYIIIAVLVFFALIIEGNAEETSNIATSTVSNVYTNSTTESAELYNSTGSLILSTNEELKEIATLYMEELERTNENYFDALSTVYKGKESDTVANRVQHITSNFEAGEVKELDKITDKATIQSGAVSPKDERTIYEHILRTEKYNFNNIIWRTFEGGVKTGSVPLTVDTASGLQYPASDSKAENGADLNLDFFISRVRPYMQSWYIPFDIMIGTQDAQDTSNLNTDLAYNIITRAYHEIVMDRYKMDTLTRTNIYRIYDQTTTITTTTRKCATYERTYTKDGETREPGEACTKSDYDAGYCKDSKTKLTFRCERGEIEKGLYGCTDVKDTYTVNCTDSQLAHGNYNCTYGVLKRKVTATIPTTETKKMCIDSIDEEEILEEDIRKSETTKDNITYHWNFVISMAKMLDKAISNEYVFEPYYNHKLDSYNNFIEKKGDYASMSVTDYVELEKEISQADSFKSEDKPYSETDTSEESNLKWNIAHKKSFISNDWKKVSNTEESKVIFKLTEIDKVGREYTDTYEWNDKLRFEESKSGIYNVDSVKDVTGDDLSYSDEKYYEDIYKEQELNLIDLMNSDNKIYEDYIEKSDLSTSTDNIGIRKSALDISYNVLEKDLKEFIEKYPVSGLMYGKSLNILEGLNLAGIAAAGSINEAIALLAESYIGYNLSTLQTLDGPYNAFYVTSHWCAMFATFVMREVEIQMGVQIPIPNYGSCGNFWDYYNACPGFYDVQEYVQAYPGGNRVITDPNHIAPLSSIQPGDLVFFDWSCDGNRDHTAIVKSVEKDESGKVTRIVTIDGNKGGGDGSDSYLYSSVDYRDMTSSGYFSPIASFVSVATVIAEAERGNIWEDKGL